MAKVQVRPMLAHNDAIDPLTVAIGPQGLWLSAKYDGIRALHREGMLQSRTLKPIPNLHTQKLLANVILDGLDGELIVGDPTAEDCYHVTESAIMSRGGEPDAVYYVFDTWYTPEIGFRQRYINTKRRVRHLQSLGLPVKMVEQRLFRDNLSLQVAVTKLYEDCWEGGIARSYNGRYKYNRSTLNEGLMLKIKQHVDSEILITALEEMQTNKNHAKIDERGFTKRSTHKAGKVGANTLGRILGTDLASGQEVTIGTGKMTADLKQAVWNNQHLYIGKIAKYRYSPHGVLRLPRHPRWIGWRDEMDM